MEAWKKIKEVYAFKGWRSILQRSFELPDGKVSSFDIVENGAFVTIAAFTQDNEALLVKQFRPGPETDLDSFPEGYIDEGENPIDAAKRELLEETGYEAAEFIVLKSSRTAYSTTKRTSILAIGCKKVQGQRLDDQEFIEVFTMPLTNFRTYIKDASDSKFTNVGDAYLALDYMGLL